jgi:RNA polymerase sigma factor (sigma-70 family)
MTRDGTAREFGKQEGVFWRVLAALARHGYPVPPSDARDLMHDFYLDAWSGVNERFDPALGSFASYLASAFYRFARRRILRLENLQQRAVDLDSAVEQLSTWKTPVDILERREQLQAMNKAVAQLSPIEQRVLDEYLSGTSSSERQLALRHALTRYGLREVLIDSLGKVAVSFGSFGGKSKIEETIAELLWKQGQSPRNVAHLLKISVAEVQEVRNRFVAALLSTLRKSEPSPSTWRMDMKIKDPLQLLQSALVSIGDEEALENVRSHAEDIRAALTQSDLVLEESQWADLEKNPKWIAAIYASIADTAEEEADFSEESKAIETLRNDEQRELGEAFKLLTDKLADIDWDWDRWFRNVKPAAREYQRELLDRPSVRAAGEIAIGLVRYGLTPETVYSATRGLSLLFNRIERATRSGAPHRFEPAPEGFLEVLPSRVNLRFGPERILEVPRHLIVAEISATPDLPPGAENPLALWIFRVIYFRPHLLQGYTANLENDRIVFHWAGVGRESADRRTDLVARWSRSAGSRSTLYLTAI